MAKTCKLCPSGNWECGEEGDLCDAAAIPDPDWTKLGTIKYDVFVARVGGECFVKIEPTP